MFGFGNRGESTFVIAGLGNPGNEYKNTRHNVGYKTVDTIASRFDTSFKKSRFNADTADIKLPDKRILLVKPLTYMNNSGDCIWRVVSFYKLKPERLIIVYDDIDLSVGTLRIRQFGGPGTHNGMRSIVEALGNDRFPRIRIGVGKPPESFDLKNYVLSGFKDQEIPVIEETITAAAKAAVDIIEFGVEKSMNLNNSQKSRDG